MSQMINSMLTAVQLTAEQEKELAQVIVDGEPQGLDAFAKNNKGISLRVFKRMIEGASTIDAKASYIEKSSSRSLLLYKRAIGKFDEETMKAFAATLLDNEFLRILHLLSLEPRVFARFVDSVESRLLLVNGPNQKSLLRQALMLLENIDGSSYGRDQIASLEGSFEFLLERTTEIELRMHLGISGQKPFGEASRVKMTWKERAQRKCRERLEFWNEKARTERANQTKSFQDDIKEINNKKKAASGSNEGSQKSLAESEGDSKKG